MTPQLVWVTFKSKDIPRTTKFSDVIRFKAKLRDERFNLQRNNSVILCIMRDPQKSNLLTKV